MITQENIPYTADEIKAMVKTCEKYNKALEKARELTDKGYDVLMPEIFPELAENKDERIRKGLIKTISSLLDNTMLYHTDITKEEALAWLEKQGENKTLDADKVIEWLDKQACLGWLEDIEVEKVVEQFKKDFGL